MLIKTIVIDPRIAGISGDMFVASLLDLGGSINKIYALADVIENTLDYCEKFKVEISDVKRRGIRAKDVYLVIKEHVYEISAIKVKEYALRVGDKMGLSEKGLSFIERVFDELISAESKIHNISPDSVHFHEIASADTVFDVVASAVLLEDLDYLSDGTEIYTTPPALGSGFIEIMHGIMAIPAPATLEILRKHSFKISSSPIKAELTTPTGAALLVSLTDNIVEFYPPMKIQKIGYGSGKKNFEKIPNVLRVIEGEAFKATSDKIVVIETNLDDVTGEIIGYLLQKLIKNGALDVSVIPALGKKNRPVNIVKVLADPFNYSNLVQILIDETGTLGVRVFETPRIIAERAKKPVKVKVMDKEYEVRVKTSRLKNGKLINIKPEYDDLKEIAEDTGLSLRKVAEIVKKQIKGLADEV